MKKQNSAQSAMEFLVTYGWAVLIFLIVISTLFYLGLLNPKNIATNTITFPSGFTAYDYKVGPDGGLYLDVGNSLGDTVNVTRIYCDALPGEDAPQGTAVNATIPTGGHALIANGDVLCANATGKFFKGKITLYYTIGDGGVTHKAVGDIAYNLNPDVSTPSTPTPAPTATPIPTATPSCILETYNHELNEYNAGSSGDYWSMQTFTWTSGSLGKVIIRAGPSYYGKTVHMWIYDVSEDTYLGPTTTVSADYTEFIFSPSLALESGHVYGAVPYCQSDTFVYGYCRDCVDYTGGNWAKSSGNSVSEPPLNYGWQYYSYLDAWFEAYSGTC